MTVWRDHDGGRHTATIGGVDYYIARTPAGRYTLAYGPDRAPIATAGTDLPAVKATAKRHAARAR